MEVWCGVQSCGVCFSACVCVCAGGGDGDGGGVSVGVCVFFVVGIDCGVGMLVVMMMHQ